LGHIETRLAPNTVGPPRAPRRPTGLATAAAHRLVRRFGGTVRGLAGWGRPEYRPASPSARTVPRKAKNGGVAPTALVPRPGQGTDDGEIIVGAASAVPVAASVKAGSDRQDHYAPERVDSAGRIRTVDRMLKTVRFAAGDDANAEPLAFRPGSINVFVGPNNCGKSLALREIETILTRPPNARQPLRVVTGVEFEKVTTIDDIQKLLGPVVVKTDERGFECLSLFTRNPHGRFERDSLQRLIALPNMDWGHVLGEKLTVRLDGQSRLLLAANQQWRDLLAHPENHLVALFKDATARTRLRQLVHEAFGVHLVIDPTAASTLRVRMASRPPVDETEEQALDARAREFHSSAPSIEEFSDGVRAYTGLLAALVALHAKILLIDEPEAFLHPPLAKRLGFYLSQLAQERDRRVFAATHSAEFLMGCIESGASVDIIRLTYAGGRATARHLPSEELRALMRDPLTRSANVLGALFYDGVVVTESDSDRAFYQEINHRLLTSPPQPSRSATLANDTDGATSCLFLNAQNKQTVHRIIGPLRRLGVPAAAIVDIDIVKEGGTVWNNFLTGANISEITRKGLEAARATLFARVKTTGTDIKRDGISTLDSGDKAGCTDLFGQLAKYGLFVVQCGELEKWLPDLGVTGKAPDWVVSMFERLGADPENAGYVRPAAGDVWDFVRQVASWLRDPDRLGMNGSARSSPAQG
jgi:energy-coupling factor transporter ATP-binding protein EcfA2